MNNSMLYLRRKESSSHTSLKMKTAFQRTHSVKFYPIWRTNFSKWINQRSTFSGKTSTDVSYIWPRAWFDLEAIYSPEKYSCGILLLFVLSAQFRTKSLFSLFELNRSFPNTEGDAIHAFAILGRSHWTRVLWNPMKLVFVCGQSSQNDLFLPY